MWGFPFDPGVSALRADRSDTASFELDGDLPTFGQRGIPRCVRDHTPGLEEAQAAACAARWYRWLDDGGRSVDAVVEATVDGRVVCGVCQGTGSKPEHVVDLETGAILDADVRPGDEGDSEELSERVLDVEERLNEALGEEPDVSRITTLTADKGYYMVDELAMLQHYGIRTVVSDPIGNRRVEKLHASQRGAVESAKKASGSKRGKNWLQRRGELVERSFTHVLDNGGARRTTVRGQENVRKRYLIQVMTFNLTLLMRALIGVGTPKQAQARGIAVIDLWCTPDPVATEDLT